MRSSRKDSIITIDWQATLIGSPDRSDGAPLLRRRFTLAEGHGAISSAVLHITAKGIVAAHLNGEPVSDELFTPGWTSYEWRLRHRTYEVAGLLTDESVLGLALGNGWSRGRLGWTGDGSWYSDDIGGLAQLEITYADGARQTVTTDSTWSSHPSAVTSNDLYDGQTVDARLLDPDWATVEGSEDGWVEARALELDTTSLTPYIGPPVRRQEVIPAREVWTSPAGKTIVDFGQNLVGWVRFTVTGTAGDVITIRHAEVLEHDELGTRPLRSARATDRLVLSGGKDHFEPTLTFHGFRYAEIDGWPGDLQAGDLEAVVVHSELRRTGTFESSHELLNQFHRNVVWGTKGNFVDVPTDCPQRDERLGWTGDLAVFAPTAAFLFDTKDFLRDWTQDLDAEQAAADGMVPYVVPDVLKKMHVLTGLPPEDSTAVWSDVAVWMPWAQWLAYGDEIVLREAWPSMTAHLDRVESKLSPTGLWDTGFQFADWLDPDAPPEDPAAAKADKGVVSTACLYRSARTTADTARVLGEIEAATRYDELADRTRAAFLEHYVQDDGLIVSDCATVYALAIAFGLVDGDTRELAGDRLASLVTEARYRVSTGFAGTAYVTDALSGTGHLDEAYRLLLEEGCPSWLYPVTMGATTIWERWDSMLPDGTINPGEMTSFNHYALGGVADWVHRVVGGIAPLEPGYSRTLLAPRPGGGITWARTTLETPHGHLSLHWRLAENGRIEIDGEIPEGTTALLRLPGSDDVELQAGRFTRD